MAGISKPRGYCRQVRAKYGQEIYLLRLPFWISSMYKSNLRLVGVSKLQGYRRQVRVKCGQEIYFLRLPFQVSLMHESDLRSAGVLKLRGYCRQVCTNAARKFTSWDFSFGFHQCMSPIWDRPGSWNSEAIANKSTQMQQGNLSPETTSLLGFVDACVRSEIGRGLDTPRQSPTSPNECSQEIYHLRLPFWVLATYKTNFYKIGRGLKPCGYRQFYLDDK